MRSFPGNFHVSQRTPNELLLFLAFKIEVLLVPKKWEKDYCTKYSLTVFESKRLCIWNKQKKNSKYNLQRNLFLLLEFVNL